MRLRLTKCYKNGFKHMPIMGFSIFVFSIIGATLAPNNKIWLGILTEPYLK